MTTLGEWSQNRNIPVVLDEYGCTVQQTNVSARLLYYNITAAAVARHGLDWAVWDDNGWFRILNRTTHEWDAEVLAEILPTVPTPPAAARQA